MTKRDPRCMWCHRRMLLAERIEMGWSVMTGAIAVCSRRCCNLWNTNGEWSGEGK